MKKLYNFILIAFIGLLIVGGILLYFFRDTLVITAGTKFGIESFIEEVKKDNIVRDREENNYDVFSDDTFKKLKNNVNKFDFDNVCSTSVQKTVIVKIDDQEVEKTINSVCNIGNNNLFSH